MFSKVRVDAFPIDKSPHMASLPLVDPVALISAILLFLLYRDRVVDEMSHEYKVCVHVTFMWGCSDVP